MNCLFDNRAMALCNIINDDIIKVRALDGTCAEEDVGDNGVDEDDRFSLFSFQCRGPVCHCTDQYGKFIQTDGKTTFATRVPLGRVCPPKTVYVRHKL